NHGIQIDGSGTSGTVIAGNIVGLTATGTAALGNSYWGIYLSGGTTNNRIGTNADGTNDAAERNIVSANGATTGYDGINIGGSNNNVVAGNYVGTDVTG